MGTVMQYKAQGNEERHQRWDRIECATLGERYGDLQAQGLSQRQAAKMLDVPRSTLQAWRAYHERLDESPVVVAFFRSVAGLAFLHRLVVALHLVYTEVGACGIRLVCLFLQMTGLNRFVGASYGTQHQVNPHSPEFSGGEVHIPPNLVVRSFRRALIPSRGQDLQVEHPVGCGYASALDFHPT